MDENLNTSVSSNSQQSLPKKQNNLYKLIFFCLFLVLLLSGIGLYFYNINSNKQSADVAPIDDNFMKVELNTIAPEDNAYFDLIKLKGIIVPYSKVSTSSYAATSEFLTNKNPSKEDIAEVKEVLEKNKQAFEIFDQSVPKKVYDCNLDNQDCNLNSLRDLALLKVLHADILFKEGKLGEAMDELFEVLDFGNKIKQSPSLIIYLVSVAIEKPALVEMQKIIDSGKLSVAQKTKYLNKLKTYSDDGTALKNAYKGEYKYQKETIGLITNGTLSEEEKKDFPVEWSLINAHTWKPNQVTLWWFTTLKNNVENVDKPCGGDYSRENNALIEQIKQEALNSETADENYVGKILFATTAASLDGVITKRCELVDLKNKIQTSLVR